MRTISHLGAFLAICFALGLCLSLLGPASVTATNDPCNESCFYDFQCGGHAQGAPLLGTYACPEGYVQQFRCYLDARRICDPDLLNPNSYNCKCVQFGCAIPCLQP